MGRMGGLACCALLVASLSSGHCVALSRSSGHDRLKALLRLVSRDPYTVPTAPWSVQVEAAAERNGRGNTDQHLTAEEQRAFRMRADGALGDLQAEDHQQFVELNIRVRSGAVFLACCV